MPRSKKAAPLRSHQHEPTCAIILEMDPDAPLVKCTCSKEHVKRIRQQTERSGGVHAQLSDGCESLGNGNYRHKILRSFYS